MYDVSNAVVDGMVSVRIPDFYGILPLVSWNYDCYYKPTPLAIIVDSLNDLFYDDVAPLNVYFLNHMNCFRIFIANNDSDKYYHCNKFFKIFRKKRH